MGVETMMIAAVAASAVASTASAISSAHNNRKSIQAQKDLYEQQRLDQLADYNERTGIEAQSKQLENIGVNPASVFAGGSVPSGSMPSVPSVPSAPVLENVGAAATGSISQMVEAVGSIQGYKERSARVQKLQQEYETEKFNTNLAKANSFLTEKYGDATWYADLMDKQNSAYLKYAQGDLAGAEKLYKDMLFNIAGEEYKMKQEDALQYAQMLQLTRESLSAQIQLSGEKVKTEKSQQTANYASASASSASARLQNVSADLQEIERNIQSNPDVAAAKLNSVLSALAKDKQFSDAERSKFESQQRRYDKLNKNDENAAAEWLNYTLWFVKQNLEGLGLLFT